MTVKAHPNTNFPHQHLLNFAGYSLTDILYLLDEAESLDPRGGVSPPKKAEDQQTLNGRIIYSLFYEDSTRTRASFNSATYHLGGHHVDLPVFRSSVNKGETFADTLRTLNAMAPDALVIRHDLDESATIAAEIMDCPVLNAGSGCSAHPTQALADALTIRQRLGRLDDLTITVVGDIRHSRVAASTIELHTLLGNKIRVVGPDAFLPNTPPTANVEIFQDLKEAAQDADVLMSLRIQRERLEQDTQIDEAAYFENFGLTHDVLKLAKPNGIILDPGPFIRDLQVSSSLVDDTARSAVLDQVTAGVAVRMACLKALVLS